MAIQDMGGKDGSMLMRRNLIKSRAIWIKGLNGGVERFKKKVIGVEMKYKYEKRGKVILYIELKRWW